MRLKVQKRDRSVCSGCEVMVRLGLKLIGGILCFFDLRSCLVWLGFDGMRRGG